MQRRLAGKLGGDDAEALLEFGQIPAIAAEDVDSGLWLNDWVALAGDGLDQRGFAAAVRAENSNMLTGVDREVDIVKNDVVSASDVDVSEF
jgi:hypothetical protein